MSGIHLLATIQGVLGDSTRLSGTLDLVILGALLIALSMVLNEWRQSNSLECRRLSLAFGLTLALRILSILMDVPRHFPPAIPLLDSVSLVVLLWAFLRAIAHNLRQADRLRDLLLVLVLIAGLGTTLIWLIEPANSYQSQFVWYLVEAGLAILGAWLVFWRRRAYRATVGVALILLALASGAALLGRPEILDLADAIAYPLFAIAAYQVITADLRAYGEELRSVSEPSLSIARKQIFLLQMSQAVHASLEQMSMLQVLADNSGLAFEADRVLLLLTDEPATGRWQVAARYHPLRGGLADEQQTHLYLQDYPLLRLVLDDREALVLDPDALKALPPMDQSALEHLLDLESLGSVVLQPLAGGESAGGLVLGARQPGRPAFSPEECRLFAALAALIKTALENARLYQELKEANQALRQLNQEIQTAYQDLRDLDQVKSSFIGMITHELRSPFVDLHLSLQILRRLGVERFSEQQTEQLAQLEQGVGRAQRMVDTLVSFASLLGRQGALQRQSLDFDELVNGAVSALLPLAQSRQVDVQVIAPAESVRIFGDPDRLSEAVHHLIHNAIKFNHPEGRAEVRYHIGEGRLIFEVEDTGPGLPADKLDAIWDGFTQAADPLRRGVEGLGLGLALVRLVVEGHGGRVAVQSQENAGSIFGFQLPANPVLAQGA